MLYPAFRMQELMQRQSLGSSRWKHVNENVERHRQIQAFRELHRGRRPPRDLKSRWQVFAEKARLRRKLAVCHPEVRWGFRKIVTVSVLYLAVNRTLSSVRSYGIECGIEYGIVRYRVRYRVRYPALRRTISPSGFTISVRYVSLVGGPYDIRAPKTAPRLHF